MSESKAPVRFDPKTGFEFDGIDSMFRAAECYLQSGFAPDAYKSPQQLVICWATGAELGLKPLQAIGGLTVINRRIGIMGDLGLAMVRQAGELADYKKVWTGEGDELTCTVTLQRKGQEKHDYSFSVKEAKVAGIYGRNPVWPQYSKRMTYYRALGFGLRDEFSDILKGLYIAEELQDMEYSQVAAPTQPVKFVDVDPEEEEQAKIQRDRQWQEAQEAQAQMNRTPLEAQLAREHPEEAAQAEKKWTDGQHLDGIDYGPSVEPQSPQEAPKPPWWHDYAIQSIKTYLGRTVGSLTPADLQLIESKWFVAFEKQRAVASPANFDDHKALSERIAYDKTAKPWEPV